MRTSILSCLVFCLICPRLYLQTVEPSSTVEKRNFQMEFESIYLIEKHLDETIQSWSIPSALFRYGLSHAFEIQFNIPFINEKNYIENHLSDSRYIFDRAQIGFSLNLWSQKGVLPEAALMYRVLVPMSALHEQTYGHLMSLNLSNKITDKLSLNYNLGILDDQTERIGYYIANLSYDFTPTFHSFIETFGDIVKGSMNKNCINFGLGINFSESLCLDLSMAQGVNHDMIYYGGNLSYKFKI